MDDSSLLDEWLYQRLCFRLLVEMKASDFESVRRKALIKERELLPGDEDGVLDDVNHHHQFFRMCFFLTDCEDWRLSQTAFFLRRCLDKYSKIPQGRRLEKIQKAWSAFSKQRIICEKAYALHEEMWRRLADSLVCSSDCLEPQFRQHLEDSLNRIASSEQPLTDDDLREAEDVWAMLNEEESMQSPEWYWHWLTEPMRTSFHDVAVELFDRLMLAQVMTGNRHLASRITVALENLEVCKGS